MQYSNVHIYLDNQSTTRVDDRVIAAMLPYLTQDFGNPSSDSPFGLTANIAIMQARQHIADLINCTPQEIYFTSGATEALNWAIRGVAEKAPPGKNHIITTSLEHSAVLKTCEFLEKRFHFKVTRINPGEDGVVDPAEILAAVTPQTLLVAVQHANNEIGTIQDIKAIGQVCRELNITFLVDAAQSIGKIDCDVHALNIDLLAASGHKLYAPKGIGFLFISDRVSQRINPLLYGGGQQSSFRPGTENVPYIVALGEACRICLEVMHDECARVLRLREKFIEILKKQIPDMRINGSLDARLPGNINFSVPLVPSDILLKNIRGIIVSKGSACNSIKKQQSHVLLSISNDETIVNSAIRIGIGRFNSMEEIQFAAEKIGAAIDEIQTASAQF